MRKARSIVAIALVLVSLSVISVSTAVAASFTSESFLTSLSGSQAQKNVFTVDTGKVECTGVSFTGDTVNKTESEVTLTPSYSGCTAFGFNATIEPNGCKYTVYASGSADLNCSTGGILIDTAFDSCNVTIPAQPGLASISFTNGSSGGKGDITADLNITNIKYEELKSGFACVAKGKATTGGKLTGSVTVTGKDSNGNPTGISHDA